MQNQSSSCERTERRPSGIRSGVCTRADGAITSGCAVAKAPIPGLVQRRSNPRSARGAGDPTLRGESEDKVLGRTPSCPSPSANPADVTEGYYVLRVREGAAPIGYTSGRLFKRVMTVVEIPVVTGSKGVAPLFRAPVTPASSPSQLSRSCPPGSEGTPRVIPLRTSLRPL
jgi:hypothetical protein